MKAIYYLIKRSTLVEIADAIRVVKELDSSIPVSKLDDALRGILSRSTARSTEHEEYLIKLQTLIDIADVVRELLGTSEKFVVRELAKRILDILNRPTGDRTPAILGIAILGKTILGDYSTGLPQLATPVIYLEEESDLPKLDTPEIYLETVEDNIGTDEPEEPEEPVQLEAPVIYLEEVSYLLQLEAPVIYLEEIVEGHEHSYTSVTTAPTCTERGYTTHTCACGSTYKDSYTDALGHSYGDPYFSSEFSTGYGRKCERCGALESMTSPLEMLATPVIHLETIEILPAKLDMPLIYLEPVVFEGEVTTAYETFESGISFSSATILSDEVLLDSAISSYTVEIDGVEHIFTLYGNSGLWINPSDPLVADMFLACSDAQGTALSAPAYLGVVGEVHHIKITETVEKPESYVGTTWKFPETFDYDTMAEYIDTYGEPYGDGYMLAFDISFTIGGSNDGTSDYDRMEFHNNGDDGTMIYYDDDTVGCWEDKIAWGPATANDESLCNIITLNEEPSAEFLQFLRTFAERQRLILAGDYALTTSPAEDVYAIIDAAELEDYLPFSIYIKYTNVSEAGDNSGLEFDHIDITEDGVVYVYEDNADYYVECYADPDDGDQTFFTVLEDTYVSEIEYKVFEALKY